MVSHGSYNYGAKEMTTEELEAQLDATNHALEFALKRIEKISAERIKEIEAHRQTTLKLVKLQDVILRSVELRAKQEHMSYVEMLEKYVLYLAEMRDQVITERMSSLSLRTGPLVGNELPQYVVKNPHASQRSAPE